MKKRLNNFIAFVSVIVIFCGAILVYMKLEEFNSNIWQSKAIIAQVQPDIILAKSQASINNAAAFSIYSNSITVTSIIWIGAGIAIMTLVANIVKLWVKNEKL